MDHFMAHRLCFVAAVVTPVQLNEFMGGSLRGVFFNALIHGFCMNQPVLRDGDCPACPLVQTCPVAFLTATLDPHSDRGADVPRPDAIEPPLTGEGRGEQRGRGAGEGGGRKAEEVGGRRAVRVRVDGLCGGWIRAVLRSATRPVPITGNVGAGNFRRSARF